ncbi:MAG: hypothetical protein AAFO96_10240 [Bacteroidota bacterium]
MHTLPLWTQYLLGLLLTLLAQVDACAQYSIEFRYKNDMSFSKPITAEVRAFVVYKPITDRDNQHRLSPGIMSVYAPDQAILRLVFDAKGPELDRKDLSVGIEGSGAFTAISPQTVRVGRRRNYIDVPIKSSGTGRVSLQIQTFEDKAVKSERRNRLDISYEVIAFNERYQAISKIPDSQMKQKIDAFSTLHDQFSAFQFPKFRDVSNVTQIKNGLNTLERTLTNWHTVYSQAAGKDSSKIAATQTYYNLFAGQRKNVFNKGKYPEKARALMAQADDNYWAQTDKTSLTGIERYMKRVRMPGYPPKHNKAAINALEDRLTFLLNAASTQSTRISLLTILEETDYYNRNFNDTRFIDLRNKINEGDPPSCEELYELATRRKTRTTCINFLNTCRGTASSSQLNTVREILAGLTECDKCREQFNTILKNEDKLEDYQTLIKSVASDCSCLNEEQLAQARIWEARFAKMELKAFEGPFDAPEGFYFLLYFSSGGDIVLSGLDGQTDSVYLAEAQRQILTLDYSATDQFTEIKITVKDEQEHDITLKAASGDSLSLKLKRSQFTGEFINEEERIIVRLQNGDGPYVLEFEQGSELRFYELKATEKGAEYIIQKADLRKENFDGNYHVTVRDYYSRRVSFKENGPLEIEQPFRSSLWMWLILPLIGLLVFLFIRNRPSQ